MITAESDKGFIWDGLNFTRTENSITDLIPLYTCGNWRVFQLGAERWAAWWVYDRLSANTLGTTKDEALKECLLSLKAAYLKYEVEVSIARNRVRDMGKVLQRAEADLLVFGPIDEDE